MQLLQSSPETLPPEAKARLKWLATARPNQITPPGTDWFIWLLLAGRGFGKTRTGAEDMAWYGLCHPGERLAVVAPTYGDARDTCIEGDSGLFNVLPRSCIEAWNRSLGELILTNGTRYKLFAAEEPERLRGPQHHRAWADELAAWRYSEAWDQLMFGLRLGHTPQVVVTTTPRPTPLVKSLVRRKRVIITKGNTFENEAHLAQAALEELKEKYSGTRLGRQELDAEILDDVPGALWTRKMFEDHRRSEAPRMQRVVVAVDPSGARQAEDKRSDDIGIVVAGKGIDGRGYVLADRTCNLSPEGWARVVKDAYDEFRADRVVAEENFGGGLVEANMRANWPNVPYKAVKASRGKAQRAEPVAALYEQGRVSHVGIFMALEDQCCNMANYGYMGDKSPDRVDALVWALTELALGSTYTLENIG